jgi:hypothetical protein
VILPTSLTSAPTYVPASVLTVPSNITDNSSTPHPSEYSSNSSSVVGAVVGTCAGSAMVIGLVLYLKKRRRNYSSQNKNTVLQMNGSKNSILV